MNALLSILLLIARTGDMPVPGALDPARLVPEDLPVFVEFDEPSTNLTRLRESVAFGKLEEEVPEGLRSYLDLVCASALKRAAIGFDYSFIRQKATFVLLLEAEDPSGVHARAKELADGTDAVVFKAGPFVGVTDSAETAEDVRDVATGAEDSLLGRKDFAGFRERVRSGVIRFHVDLAGLLPLRPGIATPDDAGTALLAAHLLFIAARAKEASGHIAIERGFSLKIDAPIESLPENRRFCAPEATGLPVLTGPPDQAARVSMRRDLAGYWKHVETLLPESAQAGLAALQADSKRITGDAPLGELLSGLGVTFDLHLCRPRNAEGASPSPSAPAVALVAEVKQAGHAEKLMAAFAHAVDAANEEATKSGGNQLELTRSALGESTLLRARSAPGPQASGDRQALPWEAVMTIAGARLIIGNDTGLVSSLAAAAVAQRTTPREPGDVIRADSKNTRRLLESVRTALATGLFTDGATLKEPGVLDRLAWFLDHADRARADLVLKDNRASLLLDISAPDLWKKNAGK